MNGVCKDRLRFYLEEPYHYVGYPSQLDYFANSQSGSQSVRYLLHYDLVRHFVIGRSIGIMLFHCFGFF